MPKKLLLMACGAALTTRLIAFWLVDPRLDMGDASSYLRAAFTLLREGTFSYDGAPPYLPTAFRPPLFAAYLAGLLVVAGQNVTVARVLLLVLSICNVVLVGSLTKRLAPKAVPIAVWLAALNPFDAVYGITTLSEAFTSALMLSSALCLVSLRGWRGLVAGGAVLGLLCLTRDIYLAMIPFGGVAWFLFGPSSRGERVRQVLVVGLSAALVIAPWTVRNAVQFGKLIPISAGRLGMSLWFGGWAVTGGDVATPSDGRSYQAKAYRTEEEVAVLEAAVKDPQNSDKVYRRLFLERFEHEPLKVLGRWVIRAPLLWFGTRFDIFQLHETLLPRGSLQWTVVKALLFLINALLTCAAMVGAVWALKRRDPVVWLLVPILFTAAVYLPLNSFENRYSMPVYDFVLILCAVQPVRLRSRAPTIELVAPTRSG